VSNFVSDAEQVFVLDSGGYLWNVPGRDLQVADTNFVNVGEFLKFKDGKKTVEGKVLHISGNYQI